MKRRNLLLGLVLSPLCIAAARPALADEAKPGAPRPDEAKTALAAETAAADAARFSGEYQFVGGDREKNELSDAIDRVIAEFFPIKRIIAGRRLRNRNPVYSKIGFRLSPAAIEYDMDGKVQVKTPLDGTPGPGKTLAGDDAKVSQRFMANRLVQMFEIENATRRNEFTLSPDGSELVMSVKVTSTALNKVLQYRLTYRRTMLARQ